MDTATLRTAENLLDEALARLSATVNLVDEATLGVKTTADTTLLSRLRTARLNADIALTHVQRKLRNGG